VHRRDHNDLLVVVRNRRVGDLEQIDGFAFDRCAGLVDLQNVSVLLGPIPQRFLVLVRFEAVDSFVLGARQSL